MTIEEDGCRRTVRVECSDRIEIPAAHGGPPSILSTCTIHDDIVALGSTTKAGESSEKKFRVFQSSYIPPPHLARGATTTEITIAFPDEFTPQMVFSYLPIGSVGFPFIINADLELTSSRQDVHCSDAWNVWVRDQVCYVLALLSHCVTCY